MRQKGTRTEKFFALAMYSGKPRPYDTELYGQFSRWGDAALEQQHMGGHVVHVEVTTKWEPVKIKTSKPSPRH